MPDQSCGGFRAAAVTSLRIVIEMAASQCCVSIESVAMSIVIRYM